MGKLKPGWKRVKFGDVVRHVRDRVDPTTAGIARFVAGEHMGTDDLRIRRWGDVEPQGLGPAFHMRFRPGQVLYGSRRTYLRKVALADFEGICANTTFILESANPQVLLPELLPFLMQTEGFHEHSKRESKGSVNPYVNFSDLAWYEFALPPLLDQRRALGVLTRSRDLLEASTAFGVAARVACQSWLKNVMDVLIGSTGRLVALKELLAGSPDSGCSAPERDEETGYWVLGLSALCDSGYVMSEYKAVDRSPAMASAQLHDGDLLITRSNTRERVGFVGRFVGDGRDVSFPDTMMRLRPHPTRVSSEWLELLLQSAPIRSAVQSTAAGTSASMKKINRQNLLAVQVPDVALEKQRVLIEAWTVLRASHRKSMVRAARATEMNRLLVNEVLQS